MTSRRRFVLDDQRKSILPHPRGSERTKLPLTDSLIKDLARKGSFKEVSSALARGCLAKDHGYRVNALESLAEEDQIKLAKRLTETHSCIFPKQPGTSDGFWKRLYQIGKSLAALSAMLCLPIFLGLDGPGVILHLSVVAGSLAYLMIREAKRTASVSRLLGEGRITSDGAIKVLIDAYDGHQLFDIPAKLRQTGKPIPPLPVWMPNSSLGEAVRDGSGETAQPKSGASKLQRIAVFGPGESYCILEIPSRDGEEPLPDQLMRSWHPSSPGST